MQPDILCRVKNLSSNLGKKNLALHCPPLHNCSASISLPKAPLFYQQHFFGFAIVAGLNPVKVNAGGKI